MDRYCKPIQKFTSYAFDFNFLTEFSQHKYILVSNELYHPNQYETGYDIEK